MIEQLENSFKQIQENVICGQELAAIGSWTHNIVTDDIYLTEEVYRILGLTPQEFDGKLDNFYMLIYPDDLEKVKEATQGALSGK